MEGTTRVVSAMTCPIRRGSDEDDASCQGCYCMAFRFSDPRETKDNEDEESRVGYCGLAGRLEYML